MPFRRYALYVGLLVFLALPASGQNAADRLIRGTVVDGTSGEALPGASLQVEGTFSGTITNAEGVFELHVPKEKARLIVRFIGYATEVVPVEPGEALLRVSLQRSAVLLPEITISGEDPAVRIMRRVIDEKQKWRENLRTYEVGAYNRFRMENDTGIVSIWESGTKAFWDRERGMREVSLWQEQTDNLDIEAFLPAALFVANLYDDNLEIAGHNLMGVTHPDALSRYRFRLQSVESAAGVPDIYVIDAEPRSSTFSGFYGTLRVQDGSYAMVSADLQPGAGFVFPPPIQYLDATYRQQFALFGDSAWLPIDLQTRMEIKVGIDRILSFPAFRIHQMSRLSDFRINVALPDSLYASDDIVVVDSTVSRPGVRPADVVAVPLSGAEMVAYATIDSTMTMEKAYEPTGALARFVRSGDNGSSRSPNGAERVFTGGGKMDLQLRPDLWYNRVEGFRIGSRGSLGILGSLRATGMIGWESAPEALDVGYGVEIGKKQRAIIGFRDETAATFASAVRGRFFNSADVTIGKRDYFDYHRLKGVQAGVMVSSVTAADLDLSIMWFSETFRSVTQQLQSSWLGFDMADQINPEVDSGRLKRLELEVVQTRDFIRFPIGPQQRTTLRLERGLGGDIPLATHYWRAEADVFLRIPTFFRRRLIPNALDMRLVAGRVWGNAPIQRLGTVDGSASLTTFGALKTIDSPPYVGDTWVLLAWEHTFRTVPFERMGWQWAVEQHWHVIVHGAHGYSDTKRSLPAGYSGLEGNWHHEAGISLSGLFTVARLDAAWRLDAPGFRIGLSTARIF